MVQIAFCTTVKNRTYHLSQTLPKNIADNPKAKFVVIDYGSEDHLQEFLSSVHCDRLAVYRLSGPVPFHMAHAKNLAHRCGMLEGGDLLVNMDADNYAGWHFDEWLATNYAPDRFFWSRMIHGQTPRGINGRIAVPAKMFLKVGGYDEQFGTWSPDDKDFHLRLRRSGYESVEIPQQFLCGGAILHNDKVRFKEFPQVKQQRLVEEAYEEIQHSESTIVNAGKIGCATISQDKGPYYGPHRQWYVLKPLPTRIFGIGMHKTATTSLHAALTILGYDSAHWPSAHWAKAVYDEMMTGGRSHTLERNYAACDLPIGLLYKELDKAYAGSKFVLTVRDTEKWIASVERHWSKEHNPFRAAWDTDPFSHRLHRLVYGRKNFDRETMLARYHQHNHDVTDYFFDRPKDLLVMDMDHGAGWSALCGFLGCPIPNVPYPKANGGK